MRRSVEAYECVIDLWLTGERPDRAIALFQEARAEGLDALMPRTLRKRVGDALGASGELELASLVYGSLCRDGLVDDLAVRAAVAQAEVELCRGRISFAHALLWAACESPFVTPEVDALVADTLTKLLKAG